MVKYTVECEYFATGEGIHYYILYCNAESEADALTQFNRKYTPYMGMGASILNGWRTDTMISQKLVPETVKSILEDPQCHFSYSAEFHMNCS